MAFIFPLIYIQICDFYETLFSLVPAARAHGDAGMYFLCETETRYVQNRHAPKL